MKKNLVRALIILCISVCVLDAERSFAQGGYAKTGAAETGKTAAGDTADILRLRKLSGTGAQCLVKTPEYRTVYGYPSVKQPGVWAQITERYDTFPEWIDELTFQFYALSKDAKGEYSLYKNTVRYADIEKGKEHSATMYVRPTTLKRYGPIVAVAVEISVGGKIIAEDADMARDEKIAKDWWKKDLTKVVTREGCLLDRSQSPFALINIDDYEVIR